MQLKSRLDLPIVVYEGINQERGEQRLGQQVLRSCSMLIDVHMKH